MATTSSSFFTRPPAVNATAYAEHEASSDASSLAALESAKRTLQGHLSRDDAAVGALSNLLESSSGERAYQTSSSTH